MKIKNILGIGLAAVGGFAGYKWYSKQKALSTAKTSIKALLLSDKPGAVVDAKFLDNLAKDYISGNMTEVQGDAALLVSQGFVMTGAAFQAKVNAGGKGGAKALARPAVKK